MIVIDASAMVEALVGDDPAPELFDHLAGWLAAPSLIDVEVQSVLRGLVLGRRISVDTAEAAWERHMSLVIHRYEHRVLATRCWQLRHQFTTYDASYLALAESLNRPLVTCDRKLQAPGHNAQVLLYTRAA